MITLTTTDAGQTEAVGRAIAAAARPKDVITLIGDLGAGKTTLVRGAARALGIAEHVTSPTFTLAQTYQGHHAVAHLDAYRLGSLDDEEIELARSAAGPGAIVFIEWPDALAGVFEEPAMVVHLDHAGGDSRAVSIDVADGAQEAAIRSALEREGLT